MCLCACVRVCVCVCVPDRDCLCISLEGPAGYGSGFEAEVSLIAVNVLTDAKSAQSEEVCLLRNSK